MASEDPNTRVDLFISYHDTETLSSHIKTHEVASATEAVVRRRARNQGKFPSIFLKSSTRGPISATIDAILQARTGGAALFLLTPSFFSGLSCVAVLNVFLKLRLLPNVKFKLRFVCLGWTASAIWSSSLVNERVPTLDGLPLELEITLTDIQDISARLSDVVFRSWECTEEDLTPHSLPTLLGPDRMKTFLTLQNVFTPDYLPYVRNMFGLGNDITHILDALNRLSMQGDVTQYKVQRLHDLITIRNSTFQEQHRRMVEAYERKWMDSNKLDWGNDLQQNLFAIMESGAMPDSSSRRPPQREPADAFKKHFDTPPPTCSELFDFESCDENNNPITAEGRLRQEVLKLVNGEGDIAPPASGDRRCAILRMGGVGKTTALRALRKERLVVSACIDGICFLEFGQYADDQKVIKQVARCVQDFRGVKLSQAMTASSLSDVLEKSAKWFQNKKILLICDDLWKNRNPVGYLTDLTILLRDAPKSMLFISTRDRNIADNVGAIVKFAPIVAEDVKALGILEKYVPDIKREPYVSDNAVKDGVQRILKTCAGLPLALAIA